MQALAEWKKFQIKYEAASNDCQTTVSGVVKKTGEKFEATSTINLHV